MDRKNQLCNFLVTYSFVVSYLYLMLKPLLTLIKVAKSTDCTMEVKLRTLFVFRILFKHAFGNSKYIASKVNMIKGNER